MGEPTHIGWGVFSESGFLLKVYRLKLLARLTVAARKRILGCEALYVAPIYRGKYLGGGDG